MTGEQTENGALPTLTVTFGSTNRKTRALNKLITVLGKSRNSDIKIDAPEVAAIHSIITRGPKGLWIRDCDSRSGTLVNGKPIKETQLQSGDTVQIGPFSFQVGLPEGFETAPWKAGMEIDGNAEAAVTRLAALEIEPIKLQNDQLQLRLRALEEENRKLMAAGGTSMANGDANNPDVAALRTEVDSLKAHLLEVDAQRARLSEELKVVQQDSENRIAVLREDLEKERNRIKDVMKQAAAQFNSARQESVHIKQQNELLQAELATKQAELEAALSAAAGVPALPADVVDYQNQLNAFRDELEQAQGRLQEQETALNESIRQNEMQLSRERAEMAREKAVVERTRNELRSELELAEREAKNYEKMSSIHKLTQEMRAPGKNPAPEEEPHSLSGRIRGFLRRLGDN